MLTGFRVKYVSLHLICYRLGIALPTVVSGDNLSFIGLKQFLQSAGSMWIRRSFAGDALYGTVVQTYLETLMRRGFNLEAFIEGGRSRTGKLMPPKFGILSYVLEAVMSGRVEDVMLCPVSTQYDKVIETESYIAELLGNPKRKENLKDFLSATSVLSLRLGRVDMRFHQPWSLRDFIADQQTRIQSLPRPLAYPADPKASTRARLLRTLAYRVLSDINAVSVSKYGNLRCHVKLFRRERSRSFCPQRLGFRLRFAYYYSFYTFVVCLKAELTESFAVMPTALVGTVLLTLRGRGVGKSELVRRVDWLCDRVRAKGGRVAHFHGAPTSEVVERALEVLGPGLVAHVDGLAEVTLYAVDRFQLSSFRNSCMHLFVTEALLCVGMYTKIKQGGGPANQRISYGDLYHQVSFLSQLFRSEFIYPIEGLAVNLMKTLLGLEADSVIQANRNESGEIASVELTDTERSRGRENYDFYCFLIWPYVEASWLAAVSLMALTPPQGQGSDVWVTLNEAQSTAQLVSL